MKTLILTFVALFSLTSAAAMFRYSELMIKDYDEMHRMVREMVAKSRKAEGDAESIEPLREALKLIFSRPNSDNMIAKLIPEVRRELTGYAAFEDSISSLAAEALGVLKNKNSAASVQATALFMLENILSEIRPEAANNEDLRSVVKRVADAKIRIHSDVAKDMKLRGMFSAKNPTDMAKDILKKLPKPAPKSESKSEE